MDCIHHLDHRSMGRNFYCCLYRLECDSDLFLRDLDEHLHRCEYGVDGFYNVDHGCMEWHLDNRFNRMEWDHILFQRCMDEHLHGG